jgi:hypothetical protein
MVTQRATSIALRPQPRQIASKVVEQTATQGVSGRVGAVIGHQGCTKLQILNYRPEYSLAASQTRINNANAYRSMRSFC